MRNQLLTGFAIHQRKYRERSHILHFFSHECGRVDGVIRQQPPSLYHQCAVHATGKAELKNFTQLDVQGQPFYLQQKALFAGFYLNEILLRLLPLEEPMPQTYVAYAQALEQLKHLPSQDINDIHLKLLLRRFEQVFLEELGYPLDFSSDHLGAPIQTEQYYVFQPQDGFILNERQRGFLGADLLSLADAEYIDANNMSLFAPLYRAILTDLLGNKPLKSRQLWISQQQT